MNEQQNLFDKPLPFGGESYNHNLDCKRLTGQLHRVKDAMKSGEWFTLAKLEALVGGSQAGISARIRDLRKPWAGSHTIEKERIKDSGLWRYRLVK